MRPHASRSFVSRIVLAAWLAAITLLIAGRPCLAQDLTRTQREGLINRAAEVVKARAYASGVDFETRWPELLEKHKERIEAARDEAGLTRVINRALGELGISHIELVAPVVARDLHNTSITGIGISSAPSDNGVRVVRLIENAPAEKAGLRVGDVILEVDGKPYEQADQIRGAAGTNVRIKVAREDGTLAEYTITRATFSVREPETLSTLDRDANLLTIPTFSAGYDKANIEKLLGEARKAPNLVVNLTDNGGGDFSNMMHLLSCLLPPGTAIGTQVSRDLAERFTEDTGESASDPAVVARWAELPVRTKRSAPIRYYEGKIAVLINGGSASASEIVAAALREVRGAILVGSQTAGAVLVSTYAPVGNGFLMKVPLSEWVTIKGMRLEGHPLVADVRADVRRRGSGDLVAAEVALSALKASR